MYFFKIKPENTFYKTHQKVCNIDPKAQWTIIHTEEGNICFVRSSIGQEHEEEIHPFKDGEEVYFFVRFNGIKRNNNFEYPLNEEELKSKVASILEDSIDILEMKVEKEHPIYMKEKNHKFYPWAVCVRSKLVNKTNFIAHINNGIGRSKRLGFGMIIT